MHCKAASKRKLGPGACDACRRSKRACDGHAPCSTCIARNHKCSYDELRKREANQGIGACDRCRKTKRACDGGSPCSTCIKYGAACCYPQLQQKQAHPSTHSPVAASTVDELVEIFQSQWGSLFPNLAQVPVRRGALYRFIVSAVMAQLSRASGDATETARHIEDCFSFSSKCTLEFAPECAEAFALLAWNTLNQNVELAAECARTASIVLESVPNPTSSTCSIVRLMSIFAQSEVLGEGDAEEIAKEISFGLAPEIGNLIASTIHHLWLAFSLIPELKNAVLSPSGFGFAEVLSSCTLSYDDNAHALMILRELADKVNQDHANAVVIRRGMRSSSASAADAPQHNVDNTCAAVIHPFFLLSTAVQCIVDAAAGDFAASSSRLNTYWAAYMSNEDRIVATCARNPLSVKALSIAVAAALRSNETELLQSMAVAMSQLTEIIPDIAQASQTFVGQACEAAATLPGFDDDVAGSGGGNGGFGVEYAWKDNDRSSSDSSSSGSNSSGSGGRDSTGNSKGPQQRGDSSFNLVEGAKLEGIKNSTVDEKKQTEDWTMLDSSICSDDHESVGSLETLYMFPGLLPSTPSKWGYIDSEWSELGLIDCLL